jgi:phosphate transport system substrate-binding protein
MHSLSLFLVTETDAYEALSLDVKSSSQVAWLADYLAYCYFWIVETGEIMRVDLLRGKISFAKIDKISSLAHSLEPGKNVITLLDKNANVLARYDLHLDGLFLSKTDYKKPEKSIANYHYPENWRQIVKDSQFQLGETYVNGYWGLGNDRKPHYEFRFGDYPMLDGSTVAVPMAIEFARQHLGLSERDLQAFIQFSATDSSYLNLIRKTLGRPSRTSLNDKFEGYYALPENERAVDLILATYPSEEEMSIADYHGETLKLEKVCLDAFVFIVNKDNPVDSLTLDQVRDIYSGKVINWADVGGEDTHIKPYQREENSGSQTGMEQLVMKGERMMQPELITDTMLMLINTVAEYDNGPISIGYSYKYYVDRIYSHQNIKILKIDGIEANQETMASETYPLTVGYYGVVRESDGPDSVGHKFLKWILSDEGQECVEQAGYVPLR